MWRALIVVGLVACASEKPAAPPPKVAEQQPTEPPPAGPTRTSIKEIAKKLTGKCVGGGWIARWRSEGHMQSARPKIWLAGFEDRTGQSIDPTYMTSETEGRMRLSGVFEMVNEGGAPDFIAQGKLLRLAEIGKGGARVSVYTAVLELQDPQSKRTVQSCEANVEGEL
jgi:hypothetical protein